MTAMAEASHSTMVRLSLHLAENSAVTVTPLTVAAVAAVGVAEEAVVVAVEVALTGARRTSLLRLRQPVVAVVVADHLRCTALV